MTRDEWLKQIEANPGDWQMALIAADEIEQAGDDLFAEQLRFAVQWTAVMPMPITRVLNKLVPDGEVLGVDSPGFRATEQKWCKRNNVRFIPAFPRSLDDVYAGRELV